MTTSTSEQASDVAPTQHAEEKDTVAEISRERSPRRAETQNAIPSRILNRESSSSIADRLASARGIPTNRSSRRGVSGSTNLVTQVKDARLNVPNQKASRGDRNEDVTVQRTPEAASTASKAITTRQTSQPTISSDPSAPVPSQKTDEPFQKFYSTISPLLSKLTAPLAFAGLPLDFENQSSTPDTTPQKPTSGPEASASSTVSPRRRGTTTTSNLAASRVTADPDYTPLFSKATLKALRETHDDSSGGANGGIEPHGHAYPFGGAESFYVVPASGGTKSYAGILTHQSQAAGVPGLHTTSTGGTTSNDLDDEFVDASETPQPPSPQASRRGGGGGGGRKPQSSTTSTTATAPNGKTLEELQLENEMIKRIVNEQSHRIQEFELASQKVMEQNAALRHGIRESQMLTRPGASSSAATAAGSSTNLSPPIPSPSPRKPQIGKGGGGSSGSGKEGQNHDNDDVDNNDADGVEALIKQRLERLEKEKQQEAESLKRDNEKLRAVVGRYRERWEKLKEGARKTRRD